MQIDVFKNDVVSGRAFTLTCSRGERGRQITTDQTIAIDGGQPLAASSNVADLPRLSGAQWGGVDAAIEETTKRGKAQRSGGPSR